MLSYFLTALILMFSNLIEAMTGFGSSVLALPFLSAVIGLKQGVAMVRLVSLVMGLVIGIINRKKINLKELTKILLIVALGMPIGIYAFSNVDEKLMSLILGIFITVYAIYTLIKSWISHKNETENITEKEETRLHKILSCFCLFFGGIVHGAFATGGPFIALYSSSHLKDKGEFRATMCSVWAVINSVVLTINLINGDLYNMATVKYTAFSAVFIALGAVGGIFLHKKISGKYFYLAVNILLLISGVSTIIQAI